jgi:hypothetical protein
MLMITCFLEDLLIYRAVDFLLPDLIAFIMKARNGSVEDPIDASGREVPAVGMSEFENQALLDIAA